MITVIAKDPAGNIIKGDPSLLNSEEINTDRNIWLDIDFDDMSQQEIRQVLKEYGMHPLAIIDTLRPRHPPKIEAFDNELFILYRGISDKGELLDFTHQSITFFIHDNFLITTHSHPSIGINKIMDKLENSRKFIKPIDIAIKVMMSSSMVYLENLLSFEEEIAQLEDDLIKINDDKVMGKIVTCRSRLIKLCRVFKYHRYVGKELVNYAKHSDNSLEEIAEYEHEVNDLNDRFDRLYTLADMHYNLCGDLLDGYLSISSHQLNNTMRVLTVITAIFVPLGFLAGLYGMNFEFIPELQMKYGYFYLLSAMTLIASTLILYFRKKHWL